MRNGLKNKIFIYVCSLYLNCTKDYILMYLQRKYAEANDRWNRPSKIV